MWGSWAKGRPPEPPKRRVIDVAKESLALMCEALETLGDGYAIYGFSGYGHDEVEFYVAKEFQDRLSARTWAAMGAMKPRRSTRMGPAIRHALAKIERQEVRMKVLIVVSDGFPQDYDYGPDRTDHEYGIQDTAKALQEAERAGVQTFCVTIDRSGNDYLRRMCPDNRYLIIDEVAALPKELAKVYRTLTA
jgi:nitric oxide reductase activation protein